MQATMESLAGFTSMPIKLAEIIKGCRQNRHNSTSSQKQSKKATKCPSSSDIKVTLLFLVLHLALASVADCGQPIIFRHSDPKSIANTMRHKTHYMTFSPSTHFSYEEGRQASGGSVDNNLAPTSSQVAAPDPLATSSSSHIHKRSSAVQMLMPPTSHYLPLVSSSHHQVASSLAPIVMPNPLSRRMMAEAAHTRWTSAQMVSDPIVEEESVIHQQQLENPAAQDSPQSARRARSESEEVELLKQKQHIQYHDQWPSMAGKCHKRTLNFCASVLPFNTTTFPNIIGDTNRFEVKRSLPFFGFLAKSSCNKRLDELLCLLLEPPCSAQSGVAIPPCKKFCRLALEGCNEYIPATLAMSSVFDCRQYPDSNDPNVCVNLAQGSKCSPDEFKCPDKTCIPRNWLCDGVRDCIFAADEANCTEPTGLESHRSICSTEEFKCDGKCVPKAWKCDGERDCLDGTDEETCDLRPRCGSDRFKCADGSGCIPKRWVCDGKAECRDGSDETQCDQRECSDTDFKCVSNGICIPKLWRCDRQADCKDASDEFNCIYPTLSTTTTTTTTTTTSTTALASASIMTNSINETVTPSAAAPTTTTNSLDSAPATETHAVDSSASEDPKKSINQQVAAVVEVAAHANQPMNYYAGGADTPSSHLHQQQQVSGDLLGDDVSRIIQQESQQQQQATQRDMKKFDYDLIPSSSSTQMATGAVSLTPSINQIQTSGPVDSNVQFLTPKRQQTVEAAPSPPATLRRIKAIRAGQPPVVDSLQTAATADERIPLYRSFSKSFKGGRLANSMGLSAQANIRNPSGPVMMGTLRRRRERHPNQFDELAGQIAANQTQPRGHGVASYLQLLNSRYNLRFSRNQVAPNVVSASSQSPPAGAIAM